MAFDWRFWQRREPTVRQFILAHMQSSCEAAETVTHSIRPIERVNLQLVLDRWITQSPSHSLIGFSAETFFSNTELAQLVQDKGSQDLKRAPVQREQVPVSLDQTVDCVVRGIYLLTFKQQPICVLLSNASSRFENPQVEILAQNLDLARAAMQQLLDETNKASVYKSKTIYLEEDPRNNQINIRFQPMPPISRDSLILPERLLHVIERNVVGLSRFRDTLKRSGRAVRHGLLLHGPPGTGKTLMLRYLAAQCPAHTVILLSGRQSGLIRESCQIARLLAPSLVILEDVDLIGQDRAENRAPVVLQDLMDEMDGLGPKADVIFLLTTNRPEVLEPALSGRPGRIDQAIEFPLPDDECRRRLFALYGNGLDITKVDMGRWIGKTDRVSPAFIEELLRKSALMAAERLQLENRDTEALALIDADIEAALDELVCFGGELTQRLLGFRQFGFAPSK
jgi:AAA+ superfamily predicted ATPase